MSYVQIKVTLKTLDSQVIIKVSAFLQPDVIESGIVGGLQRDAD